jgi:hypothetical protein
MAYGEAIGRTAGGIFGADSRAAAVGTTAGGLYDLYSAYQQNSTDQALQAEAMKAQQQLMQYQAQLAAQQAADEQAIRERVLTRASELDYALKSAQSNLGLPTQVSGQDIQNNYNLFRDQMQGDYNRTLDRVSSQGYADAIRRGMDRSTQFSDERADLARRVADELPQLDQAAWDAAIARSQGYADSLNSQRGMLNDELQNTYSAAANLEKGLLTNSAPSMVQTAVGNANTVANNASNQAGDSQTFMGTALGRFTEKVAPNIGYAFGTNDTYTDTNELENLRAENLRLKNQLGG